MPIAKCLPSPEEVTGKPRSLINPKRGLCESIATTCLPERRVVIATFSGYHGGGEDIHSICACVL